MHFGCSMGTTVANLCRDQATSSSRKIIFSKEFDRFSQWVSCFGEHRNRLQRQPISFDK